MSLQLSPTTALGAIGSLGSFNGDVAGPAASTDNALAIWNGTTGKLLQNSLATMDVGGTEKVSLPTSLDVGEDVLIGSTFGHQLKIWETEGEIEVVGGLLLIFNPDSFIAIDSSDYILLDADDDIRLRVAAQEFGIDCDAFIDLDLTTVDFGSTVDALNILHTVADTLNNAFAKWGFRSAINKTDGNDITGFGGLFGGSITAQHSGVGTVVAIGGLTANVSNTSTGTVTVGTGVSVGMFNLGGGTYTTAVGIAFGDVPGSMPTNNFAFDFDGTSWVSNGRSVSVADDGVQRYMPLSTVDTGLTFSTTNLVLATITSGDIVLTPADGVGIGTASPDASSLVEISSTTQGLLIPRMTNVQITAISTPVDGLQAHSTDDSVIYIRDAGRSKWLGLNTMMGEWGTNGAADNEYLEFGGNMSNGGSGLRFPLNATITKITIMSSGGNATKAYDLEINGVNDTTFTTAANVLTDGAVDIDVDAGERVNIFVSATGSPQINPTFVIWYKWRN